MNEVLTLEQWLELKGRIQKKYPQLKDSDLQYHESVETDLLAMVEFSLQMRNEMMKTTIATSS